VAGSLDLSEGDPRRIDHRSEIDIDDARPIARVVGKQVFATDAGIVERDVKLSEVIERARYVAATRLAADRARALVPLRPCVSLNWCCVRKDRLHDNRHV